MQSDPISDEQLVELRESLSEHWRDYLCDSSDVSVRGTLEVGDVLFAEVERLRAELAARTWQPIDTAPRDGTRVLLWLHDDRLEGGEERLGWWQQVHARWSCESFRMREIARVTHWAPLPPLLKE